MQRTKAAETLKKYKADGYKYVYFEDNKPWTTSVPPLVEGEAWIPITINPKAVAVDFVYPWDDYVTIDAAIADTELLRGRMLTAA